jgi:nucleotide-binding universal stress UspA family protein
MSPTAPPEPADRRSRLLGIKLQALAGEHLGRSITGSAAVPFPSGAALLDGDAAWILVDGPATRSLGAALAWAVRRGATSLDLVADHDTGLLARRARRLTFPVRVWFPQDRTLLAAVPEPLPEPPAAPADHLALASVISAAGATPNVEHGVVFGEVRGLEVCRVVGQPTVGHITDVDPTATVPSGGVLLEVGVGPNDREAFRLLHGDIPTVEALATVVESVARHRSSETSQHPLNRLGQERLLRWQLEQDPSLVGFVRLRPGEPPLRRANLKDAVPCVAIATDGHEQDRAVVCTVGVDPDVVGFVADVQEMTGLPVTVVLRRRDHVAITADLLALLATPVDIRTV